MSRTGDTALDVMNYIYKKYPERLQAIASISNEQAWEQLKEIETKLKKENNGREQ